jgi:hypothetical protein
VIVNEPVQVVAVHDRGFVTSTPGAVHAVLAAPGDYQAWWPGVRSGSDPAVGDHAFWMVLGGLGRVRGEASRERPGVGLFLELEGRELQGTLEWWLEPAKDGTVIHALLALNRSPRWTRRKELAYRSAVRAGMVALKQRREARPTAEARPQAR